MTKQKTLFKKYLLITMTIIISSFIVLSITLFSFLSGYWKDEKHSLLKQNSDGIAELFAESGVIINNNIYLTGSKLHLMQGVVDSFSTNINADTFITDSMGNTILASSASAEKTFNKNIPSDIIKQALGGQYSDTTTLGDIYDYNCYVVGVPIIIGQNKIGTVFTCVDARSISVLRADVIKMFLIAALSALLMSFWAVWLMSYKMVKPLRQMSYAANSFARGDFSQRVTVDSENEIGQLAAAFNEMADSLSSSENTRRSFIANVSHELKTPMTTIAGFIDGILDGTIPKEKETHYLEIVSSEIKRLSRLVKSMLNLSKIDSGGLKLKKQQFDITSVILSVLISFEQPIRDKNIQITGLENATSIFVNGDLDLMHQVAYNLVENAVKFVNQDGYIELRIWENDSNIFVSIKNSGAGISHDDINFIFDRFYKTDKSRSQDKNGMGLGLYIVKTVINLHGGDIKVSSEPGQYCEFEFWLPKNISQ